MSAHLALHRAAGWELAIGDDRCDLDPWAELWGEDAAVQAQGTQSGQTFTLNNEGVPNLRGNGRGDMVVEIRVMTPTGMTKKQEELLREFGEIEAGKKGDASEEEGLLKRLFHL